MTAIALTAVQLRDYPVPEGNGRTLYGMCTEAGPATKLWRDELGWVHIQLDGQPRVVAVPPDMVRRVDYATPDPIEAAVAAGFLAPEAVARSLMAETEDDDPDLADPADILASPFQEVTWPAPAVVEVEAVRVGVAEYAAPAPGPGQTIKATIPAGSACPHCDKLCADPRGLAAHVRAKHGGAK